MMKKTYIILGFILLLAAFIRLYQIGSVPASPDWDEVSLGYNAYSILKTGKDEYGTSFPVILRSFDDYKPALYSYLIIPFISIMDLNVVAVRMPSAIAGILTVLGTFLLVKELFKDLEFYKKKITIPLALLSSFLLAISPWHIQFSRIAFESQVGLCVNIFLFLFFLKGLKNPKFLLASFALGAINAHIYQSDRVFSPLLLGALCIIYYKNLLKIKRWFVASLVIAFLIILPFASYLVSNQNALLRAKGVSVFSSQDVISRSSQKLAQDMASNSTVGKILNNRRVEFIKNIAAGYISHTDLAWIFITGDLARHHAPDMGLMYLVELPFLLIGIYVLLFSEYNKKSKIAFFVYLILVPIPASITTGVPHAVRTLNFIPLLEILAAAGLISAFLYAKKLKYSLVRYALLSGVLLLFLINIAYYMNQYFVQQNYYTSKDWQYGYKEAIEEVKAIQKNYSKIIVSNRPHLDQSYMFFLFYLKYDPALYQKEGKYASGGFKENHTFGKYEFRPIDWEREKRSSDILYIGRPEDFTGGGSLIKRVNFINGEEAILIQKG